MRVAVIRGDIPGPVFLADMEVVSQYDPPIETKGQERYLSRPTATTLGTVLSASIPASLPSTGNIVFPLVVNAGNQTLKIKLLNADPYTVVLVPAANYANITDLVAAVNTVMPAWATAVVFNTVRLSIQTTAKGAGQRIQYDSTVGGSTFNTPASLAAGGANFTVPAASAIITATVPVGGPIDVSPATIRTTVGTGLTDAQVTILQDFLAPRFVETDVALKNFLVGSLSELLSASYNPDSSRLPPLTPGAAVAVVQDDGTSAMTTTVPTLTNAQFNVPGAGQVTLTGTGLAHADGVDRTVVKFLLADGTYRLVYQKAIEVAGGTLSPTSIVIPASKVPSGVAVGRRVTVKYTSLASNTFTLV